MGNEIDGGREDNPAFVRYSGDLAMKMLRQGGFGADETPDLFFANFKQTDIAGHSYTIDSPEVADEPRGAGRSSWPASSTTWTGRCRAATS